MQRMTMLLLAERIREQARVLVLGAGGGLELKVFAEAKPRWTFEAVDPASEMLKLAKQVLGPLSPRATLRQGYIDDAPLGPFDAATCLLTLHFLDTEEPVGQLPKYDAASNQARPLLSRISAFLKTARAHCGCPDTPASPSRRGLKPKRRRTPAR
jgi:hypothetical protein